MRKSYLISAPAGDSLSRPYRVRDFHKYAAPLRHWLATCFALICLTSACNLPLHLLPTDRPAPGPTALPEPAWQHIANGLQWRQLFPNGDELAQLIVVRIDPSLYEFRVVYRAGKPESLARWRALEADASLIINANFFDENYQALGLVVSDGSASGSSYRDHGGTFLVRNGAPEIITYRSQEQLNVEDIEQAVQGFPLLVEEGEQAYFAAGNGERTRRTMIGIDKRGQVLIIVAPFLGLSLADLSAYLPKSDLEIDTAFNLDGGGSTMIALSGVDYFQPSLDAAPTILAVYRRASG